MHLTVIFFIQTKKRVRTAAASPFWQTQSLNWGNQDGNEPRWKTDTNKAAFVIFNSIRSHPHYNVYFESWDFVPKTRDKKTQLLVYLCRLATWQSSLNYSCSLLLCVVETKTTIELLILTCLLHFILIFSIDRLLKWTKATLILGESLAKPIQ